MVDAYVAFCPPSSAPTHLASDAGFSSVYSRTGCQKQIESKIGRLATWNGKEHDQIYKVKLGISNKRVKLGIRNNKIRVGTSNKKANPGIGKFSSGSVSGLSRFGCRNPKHHIFKFIVTMLVNENEKVDGKVNATFITTTA